MARMYVAFLFDFFQPSLQTAAVIGETARECYLPLVELVNSEPNARVTVSVPHSLLNLLEGIPEEIPIIDGLRGAIHDGKVELIHSGACHPIFPLIPLQEVRRQIELDIAFKKEKLRVENRTGI